ncbi:MAG: hypothetical protein QM648_09315 [Solirubrobacterales bacterium]
MTDVKKSGGGPIALAAVFISAAGFAACITAVYGAMRDLMINSGGSCASGGPYQINPEQVCSAGQTGLLIGGILLGLVFAATLVGASTWWGGSNLAGVALLEWAALFGALGFNFIQLGFNPPENMSGAAGWIVCGIVFWLMALGGLIPGLMSVGRFFKLDAEGQPDRPLFSAPIVRANVHFERSMPGDPAQGMSDPAEIAAQTSDKQRATPVEAKVDGGFVDPVTGERTGGDDG